MPDKRKQLAVAAATVSSLLAVLAGACGTQLATVGGRPGSVAHLKAPHVASRADALPNCAMPTNWDQYGSTLIANKKTLSSDLAASTGPGGAPPTAVNAGNWAYESSPITVSGDGTFTLDFGPLQSTFNYPTAPTGFGYHLPWTVLFDVSQSGVAHIVTLNGSRYLELSFNISKVTPTSACTGYSAWIS